MEWYDKCVRPHIPRVNLLAFSILDSNCTIAMQYIWWRWYPCAWYYSGRAAAMHTLHGPLCWAAAPINTKTIEQSEKQAQKAQPVGNDRLNPHHG